MVRVAAKVGYFWQDGLVARKRDPTSCQHGDGGQCLHCMPLDPWDPVVLQSNDPPIKHLSFHSYLRKLCNGADRGRLVNLEDLRCTIKESCYGHAPWPEGSFFLFPFFFFFLMSICRSMNKV